jgi:biuret amidohydrolase
MKTRHVDADPYPWPYDGNLRPENTACIVIDMQTDSSPFIAALA